MDVHETPIPGCFELKLVIHEDIRGRFVKVFQREDFLRHGMTTEFAEVYYSVSHKGVLRGLHFVLPPKDQDKLVYCVQGEVFDAVVDLRKGSPAYGKHALFRLSGERANMVYIPKGCAHGFYALSEQATLVYQVTTAYDPELDAGIRWDSAGIPWPDAVPTLSGRDQGFPTLAEFASPFEFHA
jgi:dTDP-4-dehydrorhamnose 3,5-epimerase